MKQFAIKISSFLSLLIISSILSAFYIPNLSNQNSYVHSLIDKHNMLKKSKSPKIIFIGGSNICFSLDSKRVADAYGIDVINMAVAADFGLKYMTNEIKSFINDGDIVIVVPEYEHFFKMKSPLLLNGGISLLSAVLDAFPEGKKYLTIEQWFYFSRFIPKYGTNKLKKFIQNYFNTMFSKIDDKDTNKNETIGIYHRKAFNEYGDVTIHWNLESKEIKFKPKRIYDIDKNVIFFLNDFYEFVVGRNAKIYFLYPSYRETAYNYYINYINRLKNELNQLNFQILSTPERGKLADKYFFDTDYHLNGEGVNLWTTKIIDDLKPIFYKR